MICKLTHPYYDCYRYCYWFHAMVSVAVQRSVAVTKWPDFLPKYTASINDKVGTHTKYLWVSQLEFMQQMRCTEQNRRAEFSVYTLLSPLSHYLLHSWTFVRSLHQQNAKTTLYQSAYCVWQCGVANASSIFARRCHRRRFFFLLSFIRDWMLFVPK